MFYYHANIYNNLAKRKISYIEVLCIKDKLLYYILFIIIVKKFMFIFQIGSVRTKKDMFFVNAIPSHLQTSDADHIVFRRTDLPESHALKSLGCGTVDKTLCMFAIILIKF